MSGMALSATPIRAETSQDVRERLVTTLELELIGPTQRVLETLGPEAEGSRTNPLIGHQAAGTPQVSWFPQKLICRSNARHRR